MGKLIFIVVIKLVFLIYPTYGQSESAEDTNRFVLGFNKVEFKKEGILVPSLYIKLPLYKDGLRPGDIIEEIDGKRFSKLEELTEYISNKQSPDVILKCKTTTGSRTLRSELVSLEAYNTLSEAFMKTSTGSDGKVLYFDAKELEKHVDRGDAYRYFKLEENYDKMHWDLMEYRNLEEARTLSEKRSVPMLLALFGSKNCCNFMSLAQADFEKLLVSKKAQRLIKNNYVSLLVLKPEAYQAYKDHSIDADQPALLLLNKDGQLQKALPLTKETSKSALLDFLRND